MAKQAGVFMEGTVDDLTYYQMEGSYYVRMKSSLTAKKFWKSKTFERSRESCRRFSEGNKLASRLYRMIEEEKRNYKLFCFLKRRAIQLLKEGRSLTEAEGKLVDYLKAFALIGKNKTENQQMFKPVNRSFTDNAMKGSNARLLNSLRYRNYVPGFSSEEPSHFDIDSFFIQPITNGPHKCDYG